MTEGRKRTADARPRRFPLYPKYKDSGVAWLGEIPTHWHVRRLKTLASVQLSNVNKKSEQGQARVRLCNYVDVYYNERITADLKFMSATATAEQARRFVLRVGDVLITKDSESWNDIAVPAVVVQDLKSVLCGYHLAHIKPGPSLDGRFLSRQFSANGVRDQFHVSANGITRFGLGGGAICTGLFPIAPLEEQHAIADFLDRETAKIDALVAKKEQLIELLREKRTALINRAVTRGLNPNAPVKDSGISSLGKIPAHWEVKKVTWLFRIGSGTTPRSEEPAYYGGQIPWVTTSELRESVVTATEKNVTTEALRDHSSLKLHPAGSIAVAMYGATIGRLGMLGVPATVNQACCVFSHPDNVNAWYWFYWMQMRRPYLVALGYGGGQPNLSQELLRSIRASIPPQSEQEKIVEYVDAETASIHVTIAKVRHAIRHFKEFRTALISAAATGKIDVRKEAA